MKGRTPDAVEFFEAMKSMRRFPATLLLLVLTAATAAPCPAQTIDKKTGRKERTVMELMQLERDIGKANVNRDAPFFERVEADEFIFTDASGGITTKKEDVDSVKAPPNADSRLLAYEVDDMKVSLYGRTAVVTGRTTTRGTYKDKPWSRQSRFTDVFVWRDNRWQIVAGHSSRIPQK